MGITRSRLTQPENTVVSGLVCLIVIAIGVTGLSNRSSTATRTDISDAAAVMVQGTELQATEVNTLTAMLTPPVRTADPQPEVASFQSARPSGPVAAPSTTPTEVFRILPYPTINLGVCPRTMQECIPCNKGEQYCRHHDDALTGFLGWACQNNNPGNIRYSQFRIDLITQFGGPAPCGSAGPNESSQYMVFGDYLEGRSALGVYLEAIAGGGHPSYLPVCANGGCTLRQFFSIYAPAGDQNNPNSYSNYVAAYIGVNADVHTLRWILDNKKELMINAIQQHEGWFVQE
ncbi:MAG: hypothetical protein TR69_WS6001000556 [candidate division WS6 bacterium OLB20]|uniref:Uncharacterized protein n=1 Tax=candidate division WS6 bacterium OLB20 TaxID=1617426 RepID=A0A136LY13_9BACT|nr:MAG: hypothetical protein TR69_WS6001000556 [candidate division WS6 bacterium OLB20]